MDESTMTSRIVLTYEDYATLPNDGKRYELHEGELSLMGAPSARHQLIIGNLYFVLRPHVQAHGRGQLFLSPSSRHIDRRLKMTLYAKHAVDWYWIVDGDALTIDAYRLDAAGYVLDARLEGTAPRALPPFLDLPLDPAAIWP